MKFFKTNWIHVVLCAGLLGVPLSSAKLWAGDRETGNGGDTLEMALDEARAIATQAFEGLTMAKLDEAKVSPRTKEIFSTNASGILNAIKTKKLSLVSPEQEDPPLFARRSGELKRVEGKYDRKIDVIKFDRDLVNDYEPLRLARLLIHEGGHAAGFGDDDENALNELARVALASYAKGGVLPRAHSGCENLGIDGVWQNSNGDLFRITQPTDCDVQIQDVENKIRYKVKLSEWGGPYGPNSMSLPDAFYDLQAELDKNYLSDVYYGATVMGSGGHHPRGVEIWFDGKLRFPGIPTYAIGVGASVRIQILSGKHIRVALDSIWIHDIDANRKLPKLVKQIIEAFNYTIGFLFRSANTIFLGDGELRKISK